jgi:hypothetical protein
MILLVTDSARADECAAALHVAAREGIVVAESLPQATSLFRSESFQTVVLDQHLLENAPLEAETTLDHLGNSILIQVNLGIWGMDRLVREVRAAVQRRKREGMTARQAAIDDLHSELNSTLTALLLSIELALEVPGIPSAATKRLEVVHELVKKLHVQLEMSLRTEGVGASPRF